MKIRELKETDLPEIKRLYEEYYPDLIIPDLMKMLNGFVIENEDENEGNKIVMAGGIELIAEAFLITNKSKSEIQIGKALVEAQRIAIFTCNHFNIKNLLAFTDNESYAKHLIQHGFIERNEKALNLSIDKELNNG